MQKLYPWCYSRSGGRIMAGGWAKDGAAQDQIDASVDDAVKRARSPLAAGDSARLCVECGCEIRAARRTALPGVQLCIACQTIRESEPVNSGGINRRGSKDSQLR